MILIKRKETIIFISDRAELEQGKLTEIRRVIL